MNKINITFDDGKQGNFDQGITVLQAIQNIYPNSYQRYIAAVQDGQAVDLNTPVTEDATFRLLTADEPDGLEIFWHSASHLMAQAVKMQFNDVRLGIGPAISAGFYYDFQLNDSISAEDFPRIEQKMLEIVKDDQPFVRKRISKKEALELFKQNEESFKVELIEQISDESVTIYENGSFFDLCRGPHVPSTGYIKHFKLLSTAGAYWHGDERNPVLQRLYGIAYPSQESIDRYLLQREEAQKRDHRKLGREMDLFSFQAEGPGFPFWHPNGVILYRAILDYMREVLTQKGYSEIMTPIVLDESLWHQSGHWDNYKNNMYFTNIDEQTYALKPMNCPGCVLVYKQTPHSYRDLPLKLSEMGLVHRHEKSGVLHGLIRVREFTQDDAHVFCTPDQMEEEIIHLIELVDEVYRTFGYEDYQIELSTRPAKSIGTDEMWNRAENALSHALEIKAVPFKVNQGEGAFYGPKIDYHIQDSIGRMWQCGTIQVDFSMPERFELEYVGTDGGKHRPVMLHRAILGSIERFIGILIEHYGGAFPVWLSPVQCIVLPISEKHQSYAESVQHALQDAGIRSKLDDRSEKVGYKIRDAETKKIPYMAVVGDKEVAANTISVRKRREGDKGAQPLSAFIDEVKREIMRRTRH